MIVLPAIDLKGGKVVQLVGGDPAAAAVTLETAPAEVARRWQAAGARWLHVVDLDRALATGDNDAHVETILRSAGLPVEVGGGIRSVDRAQRLLDLGAARIIAGTKAVQDPLFLRSLVDLAGDRVCVAVDSRHGKIVTHGWAKATGQDALVAAKAAEAAGAGAILFTEVSVEGALQGPDVRATERLARGVDIPVIASGGVTTEADLRALSKAGAWGAVVGMALYTGRLPPQVTGREF